MLTRPWPSMARTLYKEPERFVETYWDRYGRDIYLVGDAARRDEDGYFWIVGRIDDVINVSGHRLSTMEVESTLVSNPQVAEAAVIGVPDEITGQAIVAFVIPEGGRRPRRHRGRAARATSPSKIGKLARPKRIVVCDDLPKTRSGKIMRRILRDIAAGERTWATSPRCATPTSSRTCRSASRRADGADGLLQHVSIEVPPDEAERMLEFWRLVGFERGRGARGAGRRDPLGRARGDAGPPDPRPRATRPRCSATRPSSCRITPRPRTGSARPASRCEDTRQLWGADRAFAIAPGGHRVELMAAPPPTDTGGGPPPPV